eukprot:2295022-Prymnesium_polylepis.3
MSYMTKAKGTLSHAPGWAPARLVFENVLLAGETAQRGDFEISTSGDRAGSYDQIRNHNAYPVHGAALGLKGTAPTDAMVIGVLLLVSV